MRKGIDTVVRNQNALTPVIPSHNVRVNRPVERRGYNFKTDKIRVSLEDIRILASTLYLKSIPGLGEIEADYDSLINDYYQPAHITD